MSVLADLGATLPAGLGAAFVMLVQQAAKYLRVRSISAKVRKEATEAEPMYGTAGWVWKEVLRERGARHAMRDRLDAEIVRLRERLARVEGTAVSGEQEHIDWSPRRDNDTDPVPGPPMTDEPRARQPSYSDARRAGRRTRP